MPTTSSLDKPIARLVALLVFAVCAGFLLYIHRNDLAIFSDSNGPASAEASPYEQCRQERLTEVSDLAAENLITEEQRRLFVRRAEDFCRSQFGQ